MSNSLANRNLLFGILGVERNVIGRDALVAALNAWVAAKSKGMAQILREQQAITENQHAIMEECVDAFLARHGNDAAKSLAALCLVGPARDDLQAIDDPDLHAALAHVSTTPILQPAPAPEPIVVAEAAPPPPKIRKTAPAAPQPAAKSGVSGCVWLAAGVAMALTFVVVAIGGGFLAVLWLINGFMVDKIGQPNGAQVAQVKPNANQQKPDVKEPAPIEEPPVPNKEPGIDLPEPPIVDPPLPKDVAKTVVPAGFEPLFNGKDLTGWKQHALFAGIWRVENGILTGAPGPRNYGRLETEMPQPKDFHLRVEARVIGKALGHVAFRSPQGSRVGYDVTMGGGSPDDPRTGGLILQGPANRTFPWMPPPPMPREQWFVLEVIAEGSRIIIKVDGKTTTDVVDLSLATAGHIALGQRAQDPVEFRRIDIKALKPGAVRPAEAIAVTPGFTPLFNGKDLTGWKPHKITPGNWRVENGILVGDAPGKFGGGRLYTEQAQPADFHLRVETRISDKGSGAVLFRCQDGTIVGYEAAINSTAPYIDKTGSLAAQIPGRRVSVKRLDEAPAPPDQWVTLEIIAQGERLIVKVNGKTTANILEQNRGPVANYIVLTQNASSTIEFRKVEIKQLDPVVAAVPAVAPFPPADGFVPLFNGKDLTGWKSAQGQPRDWQVIDGILTGVGGRLNMLYTPRDDYIDFHLRAEARINDDGLSSIAFRYRYGPVDLDKQLSAGYGVRLNGRANDLSKTGSLFAYEKVGMRHLVVKEPLTQPGQWFNLEIIAKGNLVTTKVNGQVAISYLNPKTDLVAGRIVLEANSTNRNTVVEYRKIEIKESKPATAVPPLPVVAAPLPAPAKGKWVALFNGNDLDGWRLEGNKLFHAGKVGAGGALAGNGPDAAILTTRKDFHEFTLRVELSCASNTEAYFALRQSADPKGKWLGLTSRIEGDLTTVRAGYAGIDAAKLESGNRQVEVMAGEVFTLEFKVTRDSLRILGNGKMTGGLGFAPDRFPPGGAIGLFVAKGGVSIRKLEINEETIAAPAGAPPVAVVPPPMPKEGFVALFNGKDLTGWQAHPKRPGNWRVNDGILVGSAPAGGSLYSTRGDYQDFHLRAEVRINDKGFSRVLVRAAYDPAKIPLKALGYEALINQRPVGDKTGTLRAVSVMRTAVTQAAESPTRAGEWFVLEVVAKGDRVTVSVNGKPVADFVDDKSEFARQGHIVLHQDANATLEFRKVEVRDLPDAK